MELKGVYIIAEAGVNHNGDIRLAKELIDVAKACGVDAVKFQTWNTDILVDKESLLAEYQKSNAPGETSQYEMLKKLELSQNDFIELKAYCDQQRIEFLSTPDELDSAKFLNTIQDKFKIGSGELTNTLYLKQVAKFGKPVILSTGMGDMKEVEEGVNALLEGGLTKEQIFLLHATTEYPAPMNEINLRAMLTLKEKFKVEVGYSDHTEGIEVPIAAVAMGARIIEKHFTLNKSMIGPDHKASLNPEELKAMVCAIRNIELAMGNGIKLPTKSELKNKELVRKKIFLMHDCEVNHIISEGDIYSKRTNKKGLDANEYKLIIGKMVLHAMKSHTILTLEDLD
ncbi:MAG: N-acetylneuraminate synthase [Chitinophagales bacterium]|nr:N-acetylneuraminate synthase [Chitinophagales bacterium]